MADIVKLGDTRHEVCFQLAGSDRVWHLPTFDSLPMKLALKLAIVEAGDDMAAQKAAIDLVDEICPGLTDELTLAEFRDVFDMWVGASAVSPGESQASPESLPGTAGR